MSFAQRSKVVADVAACFGKSAQLNPESEIEFLQWEKKTTDYTDYTDFFGLEFFTICNFGEVANGTYFNL